MTDSRYTRPAIARIAVVHTGYGTRGVCTKCGKPMDERESLPVQQSSIKAALILCRNRRTKDLVKKRRCGGPVTPGEQVPPGVPGSDGDGSSSVQKPPSRSETHKRRRLYLQEIPMEPGSRNLQQHLGSTIFSQSSSSPPDNAQ
ncbi:hypothetical protein QTP88_016364 [Uroleucon formosanum]